MLVGGLREVEEVLEEAVDVGGGEEVLAAGDEGDVLGGVIGNDGEVVGGADVFAGEDDIAEEGGGDGGLAVDGVAEGEGAGFLSGELAIETPGGGFF